MRHERLVLIIAAALSKRLGVHVAVIQGEKFTEWSVGDGVGFAVGHHTDSYPPKKLIDAMEQYIKKYMKIKK